MSLTIGITTFSERISHLTKLLPLNIDFVAVYGQSYKDISDEYIKIVKKYDLINSNKLHK